VLTVPDLSVGRLELGAFRLEDAPELLRLVLDDPVMVRFSGSLRHVRTEDDALRWLERRHAPGRLEWAAREGGRLVGRVGLHDIETELGQAELGYGVFAPYRGRGIASALAGAVTAYAFESVGLNRVELLHAVANAASCRVAAACGYAFEGLLRHCLLDDRLVAEDGHLHARLRDDPPGPLTGSTAVELRGHGLLLRRWRSDDAGFVLAALADPGIRLWNPITVDGHEVADLDDARRLTDVLADWTGSGRGRQCPWVVESGGAAVGMVAIHHLDIEASSGELAYFVLPRARGQRVGARASDVATRWAFAALGLRRLALYHGVENAASCAVARRAGFAQEGLLRASYRYGDGELHDEHLHARLAEDPEPVLG